MMKSTNEPLSKDIFDKKSELEDQLYPIVKSIEDRIGYIAKTIFKTFGSSFENWYVQDAEEGEVGDIDSIISDDRVDISMIIFDSIPNILVYIPPSNKSNKNWCIISRGGGKWSLKDSFPSYWLYEDFEEELKIGKSLWEDSKPKKVKDTKSTKNDLINSAKAKLTKEEKKALGLK